MTQTPAPCYRLLNASEIIQDGDEWLNPYHRTWEKYSGDIGKPFTGFVEARRLMPPPADERVRELEAEVAALVVQRNTITSCRDELSKRVIELTDGWYDNGKIYQERIAQLERERDTHSCACEELESRINRMVTRENYQVMERERDEAVSQRRRVADECREKMAELERQLAEARAEVERFRKMEPLEFIGHALGIDSKPTAPPSSPAFAVGDEILDLPGWKYTAGTVRTGEPVAAEQARREGTEDIITGAGVYIRNDGKFVEIGPRGNYGWMDENGNTYDDVGNVAHGSLEMNIVRHATPAELARHKLDVGDVVICTDPIGELDTVRLHRVVEIGSIPGKMTLDSGGCWSVKRFRLADAAAELARREPTNSQAILDSSPQLPPVPEGRALCPDCITYVDQHGVCPRCNEIITPDVPEVILVQCPSCKAYQETTNDYQCMKCGACHFGFCKEEHRRIRPIPSEPQAAEATGEDRRPWVYDEDGELWHAFSHGHYRPALCGAKPIPGTPIVTDGKPRLSVCGACESKMENKSWREIPTVQIVTPNLAGWEG